MSHPTPAPTPVPTELVLESADVIGLYFSAEWCNPCRQFTPVLQDYYKKLNEKATKHNAKLLEALSQTSDPVAGEKLAKKMRKKPLEIVFVPRSREFDGYVQYFASMPFVSLPFEEATGDIGTILSKNYNIQSIPSLIFVDAKTGKTITKNGRDEVMKDKNGRHFPYHSPINKVKSLALLPFRAVWGVGKGLNGVLGIIRKIVFNIIKGALGWKVIE